MCNIAWGPYAKTIDSSEKIRSQHDSTLMAKLRGLLEIHEYPIEGRDGIHIGFESRETVDRESNGNRLLTL